MPLNDMTIELHLVITRQLGQVWRAMFSILAGLH